MKRRTNKSIESFIVIILMIIVLAAVVILMNSGRIAYSRIVDNSNGIQNARTALSYLSMKVRQNDMEGSMEYREGYFNGTDALVIRHGGAEEGMITYIFHDGTSLREAYVMADREADPEDAIKIVDIDDFVMVLEEDKGMIRAKAVFQLDGALEIMERTIGIRSWGD